MRVKIKIVSSPHLHILAESRWPMAMLRTIRFLSGMCPKGPSTPGEFYSDLTPLQSLDIQKIRYDTYTHSSAKLALQTHVVRTFDPLILRISMVTAVKRSWLIFISLPPGASWTFFHSSHIITGITPTASFNLLASQATIFFLN